MEDKIIKFHSNSFNYSEEELNKIIPIIQSYLTVLSNGLYSEVELEELFQPIPEESDSSYEKIQLIHHLMNLLLDEALVYIIQRYNETSKQYDSAAMVLYSRIENSNQFLIEFVETRSDYQNCGLASKVLKESFNDLKQQGVLAVYAHVNINNYASINLNEGLGTVYKAVRNEATPNVIDYIHVLSDELIKRIQDIKQKDSEMQL